MGLSGKERQQPGGGARPSQAQSELDKGFGAWPPLPSFSTPLLFPPSPSWTRKEGNLLLLGVGLPPFLVGLGVEEGKRWRGGRKGGAAPPLLVLFGLGGKGGVALP